MKPATTQRYGREGGYILIAAMVMLLVLTFLGISMYRSFTSQESMAANSKEKARAFQVAQSTLQYGEFLLANSQPSLLQGGTCATTTPLSAATICQNSVNIVPGTSTVPMKLGNGLTYTTMAQQLTINPAGGAGTYYANPQMYIQYLGISPDGTGLLYMVTALAYGGNSSAVAVVQSTFETSSGIKNLGGL
ncbi:pilus assembly PilX family protein [Dyella kyungheensis]|uniref:pilus assembly PilX family protein n=1 Tax=Dyella kyungheensis TaxID=1242174 RepID=UPI003CEB3455